MSFVILLCLVLIMLLISLYDKGSHSIDVAIKQNSTVRSKRISQISKNNTNRRMMIHPIYRPMRRIKDRKGSIWQRILKETPLLVGSIYSRGRTGVPYVLGVPTVHRPGENYLLDSLTQLIENMSNLHRRNCLIVVYIGETNTSVVERIWQDISQTFGEYLDEGLIDVITPPTNYYPDFDKLHITLHDNPARVRWRSKQTLDYMYLMSYAQSRGTYYLQLEDDIVPTDGYFDYIVNLAALHTNFRLGHHRNWIVMSFCDLGFIGKLFHTKELKQLLSYVQIFFNDQPIDWLLQSYVKLRCCRWDSFEMSDCAREYSLYFIRADQSQFQHNGLKSSLRNKEQQLRDKRFDKDSGRQRMSHLRQPLNLIISHKTTTLTERLHLKKGETFIWGYMPQDLSLMRYLRKHQYDANHLKIRNGPHNSENFSELMIDVVQEVPTVFANSSESKNCGFIMSYTSGGRLDPPSLTYFYVKENETVGSETSWFRRFIWSNLF
ncbi:alpha-1,3-mannosyl-glycoprotein 4-beta-N-acetylglucosaminyltransferase A [Drosophila innubila]|uniref:alpha-1,3-mannosyl-glycoprotein 4-beta-N-acetylglucosaminyltransferase A n=1 Tax=Drosophila innubila TaxID=198719 RepID=UPI00148E68B2|nr:alpha-1,3-mannosyl-glycoprotein 4-beta-N-acetylglucosaminyltransferase A [Drosophila innubila]